MALTATAITLVVGFIIGFLGQRSRFCIISGFRDVFVIRDFYRIKGLIGLILGAVSGYILFNAIGGEVPDFPMPIQIESGGYWIASIVGGVGMGFFSVLAEGCPFRQHVMAGEGRHSALFYLLGFYVGIAYFYLVTFRLLALLVTSV
jgi:uncharacterized membrane protein YedE/YeeE